MAYQAIQIANEFIASHGEGGHLDPMKLQKLLYFADGWWTALCGVPLISERPQVWRYGPVYRSIYRTFSKYGKRPILEPEPATPFGGEPHRVPADAVQVRQLIEWIWNEYGNKSGPALSDETHKPGTPWRKIAEKNHFVVPENHEISLKDDWHYFAGLARERGYTPRPLA
jgi:uncharacterized phage-associated protein